MAVSLAKRLLGRVLGSTRRPSEAPPPPAAWVSQAPTELPDAAHGDRHIVTEMSPAEPSLEVMGRDHAEHEPERDQLASMREGWDADLSWRGVRTESAGPWMLVAWRLPPVEILRRVEVSCAFGDELAEARVSTEDIACEGQGSLMFRSASARVLVALGVLEGGAFVSRAHAVLR